MRTELSGYITLKCNSRCIHCAVDAGQKKKEELSFEEWKKILKKFSEIRGKTFTVHGGEPFIRHDMIPILQYATSLNLQCGVITNGLLLDDRKLHMLKDCTEWVLISLDGPGTVYKELRGVDGAEKTITTIEKAKEIGVNVGIDFVVTRKNIEYIDWIVDIAVNLQVEWLTLELLRAQGRGEQLKDYLLEGNHIIEVNKRVETLNKKYGGKPRFITHGEVDLKRFKDNPNLFKYANKTFWFFPDGVLLPDIALPDNRYWYAGNLLVGFDLNKQKIREYETFRELVFTNVCKKLSRNCPVNWEEEIYKAGKMINSDFR